MGVYVNELLLGNSNCRREAENSNVHIFFFCQGIKFYGTICKTKCHAENWEDHSAVSLLSLNYIKSLWKD